jgi:sodium transport system ATP-binding protein
MVEAHGLSKTFTDKKRGGIHALEGVSFAARPGEILGVLGPNGAGKTTLLRLLATILEPSAGTATVAGHDIRRQPEGVRQSIGYLTGSAGLYERLSPREMIGYFGELYGLTPAEIERRRDEIFTTLEIHEFADRRCDKLSTGQKQRVGIARAILHHPPVIFFDEPTGGLDVVASRAIVRFIRRCRDEGRVVLLSTHLMSEAEALCDRIAVIYGGKLAAVGTLPELRAQTGETAMENVFLRLIGADPDQ